MRAFGFLVLLLAVVLVLACGDDDDDDDDGATEPPANGGEATEVAITLQEFSVLSDPESGSPGSFTFNIENVGPDDPHEFVIFQTDLAPDDLPTLEDGSVDEEGEGVELIDEVEDIAVDGSETLEVDLAAGNYAFICNIVEEEDGETESHYQEGMLRSFAVE
jgi:hypothetical protein